MSELNITTTITSLAVAILSVLSLSANAAAIGNSVSENSIAIDGSINDWAAVSSLGYDAATLDDVNAKADFVEGWMAHDSQSLYLAYRNNGDIDDAAWWAWQVYLDTDLSTSTGYKSVDSVGAEYLLQGSGLYKYTGSGTDWSWQSVPGVTSAKDGAIAEFKIPRNVMGNPSEYRAVFKARNGAFTGDYSASGVDTYPRSLASLTMHNDLLFRQPAIWPEPEGTLPMRLSASASVGATELKMTTTYPLVNDQLIAYLATDDEYYTAHVESINGRTITLNKPLVAAINAGQNVWNFYEEGAHPNVYGYRAVADFAIRNIGLSKLNTGKHIMLGDSWFDSVGIAERLSVRLSNAVIINEGIGGSTTTNLLNRFDSVVSSQNPDFVWVIGGLNDAYHDTTPATYLTNMQGIIAKISSIGAEGVIFGPQVSQYFNGSDARKQLSHRYAEALSADAGDGFVDYEFGAIVPPPETGDISNAKSITVDGDLSDWEGLISFGADGNDINLPGSRADILEAWMAHDDSTFYMAYRNDGDVDQATWWPWQTYLDTDKDESTGFKAGNGVGANYVIQGGGLYLYIGTGSDWAWQYVASTNSKINGDIVELSLPRSAINNPPTLSAIMKTRNGIFTGNYSQSSTDSYPNVGSGHFNYKLGEGVVEPPVTAVSNPLPDASISLNGDLADWGTATSFGRDANDIALADTQADWLETWMAHDSNNLYFAYENDGALGPLLWPWQIYIDADSNPDTGYKASNAIGAEFLLEGASLSNYAGTGYNWSWDTLPVTESAIVGSISEISVPRSALGGITDFRLIYRANNQPFTGSSDLTGIDYFPDNAMTGTQGYFSYSIQ